MKLSLSFCRRRRWYFLHCVSLAGYPFALIYRRFLFYQSATVIHLFHTFSGLALATFNFGEMQNGGAAFTSLSCDRADDSRSIQWGGGLPVGNNKSSSSLIKVENISQASRHATRWATFKIKASDGSGQAVLTLKWGFESHKQLTTYWKLYWGIIWREKTWRYLKCCVFRTPCGFPKSQFVKQSRISTKKYWVNWFVNRDATINFCRPPQRQTEYVLFCFQNKTFAINCFYFEIVYL